MNISGIGLLVLLAASCVTCGPRIPRAPREQDDAILDAPYNEVEKDKVAARPDVAVKVDQGATPYASNDEAEKSREVAENPVGEQPNDSGEDDGVFCKLFTPLGKMAAKATNMLPSVLSSPANSALSFADKMFC